MAGTYQIQPHAESTPQTQSDTKTTFFVKFVASNGKESSVQYYECESTDVNEIKATMQKVADDYDSMILAEPVPGQIEGL